MNDFWSVWLMIVFLQVLKDILRNRIFCAFSPCKHQSPLNPCYVYKDKIIANLHMKVKWFTIENLSIRAYRFLKMQLTFQTLISLSFYWCSLYCIQTCFEHKAFPLGFKITIMITPPFYWSPTVIQALSFLEKKLKQLPIFRAFETWQHNLGPWTINHHFLTFYGKIQHFFFLNSKNSICPRKNWIATWKTVKLDPFPAFHSWTLEVATVSSFFCVLSEIYKSVLSFMFVVHKWTEMALILWL